MEIKYYSLWISAAIAGIFILQLIFPSITDSFKLVSDDVTQRPWIIVSAIFLHGDIVHLLYNLFGLALFGLILEAKIGSDRMLAIFFISGIVASLTALPFYDAALGASGAIFGIIGALALLRPGMVVWVSYIPMPMFVAAIVWATGDIFGLFMPGNTANASHLGGLAVGVAAGIFLRKDFSEKKKKEKVTLNIPEAEIKKWEEKYMFRKK